MKKISIEKSMYGCTVCGYGGYKLQFVDLVQRYKNTTTKTEVTLCRECLIELKDTLTEFLDKANEDEIKNKVLD